MRSDPNAPIFYERLWPSPGIWTAAIAFGAAFGLIPGPINTTVAWITGIVGAIVLGVLLAVTTPTVMVTEDLFVAGRARVPLTLIGSVEPLDAAEWHRGRGVGLDARAFLCTRAWLPIGAKVTLCDPEDPTPYWLVSSRRPDALAAAVSSRIARADQHD
jgi:hypothetical protein